MAISETRAVAERRVLAAVDAWDWDSPPSEMAARLPLLERFREQRRHHFFEWDVLLIQHHLSTFLPLVQALLDDGMDVQDSWHVDIPYSTNTGVNDTLRKIWSRSRELPPLFLDPLGDYSEAQLLRVSLVVQDILQAGRNRRLLVVDDGAYFARSFLLLARIGLLRRHEWERVVLVEQTTRGERFLLAHVPDLNRLNISAVSVASSVTKRTVEAPCIGASVAAAVRRRAGTRRKIAVLGYGSIGKGTVSELSRAFPEALLFVVDKRNSALKRADADSRSRWTVLDNIEAESEYDLIVGCTGSTAFTVEHRHLLADGALLASGSSAAVEFDRAGFVDISDYYPEEEIEILGRSSTRRKGIHADIRFRFDRSKVATFLNAGFPVNFDGRPESLPPNFIQATRCLMYAAAAQVTDEHQVGLASLRSEADEWILENALDFF